MMDINVASGLFIKNAWTGAGVASFVQVSSHADKSVNILFDCGSVEPSCLRANKVFITHGHIDHCGSAILHARSRSLSNDPAVYYVPPSCLESMMEAKAAFEKLDGKEIRMNIVCFNPNSDSIKLSGSLRIVAFDTVHRVPSQGYAIYYQPKPKLMEKYRNLSNLEIRELKNRNICFTESSPEILQFVYTGDTTFDGLLRPECLFIFKSPILVMECTYLEAGNEKSYQKSIEYSHVHIDDIVKYVDLFVDVEYLVLVHFSMQYTPFYVAVDKLIKTLPGFLLEKCYGCMKALGSREFLTKISMCNSNSNQSAVGYGWGSYRTPPRKDKQKQLKSNYTR